MVVKNQQILIKVINFLTSQFQFSKMLILIEK